jgi:nuclear pore complex protein Nup62
MDEIITRWASDLSKYQKEFQAQAEQVAIWDRTLVENSDKISKLYSKTFQAERDAAEVERQLTLVEGQQEELGMWLERYEKEVDEMIKNQVRGREGLQGPDQERERTYVPNSALEFLASTFIDLCIDTSLLRNCPTVSMSLTGTLQR